MSICGDHRGQLRHGYCDSRLAAVCWRRRTRRGSGVTASGVRPDENAFGIPTKVVIETFMRRGEGSRLHDVSYTCRATTGGREPADNSPSPVQVAGDLLGEDGMEGGRCKLHPVLDLQVTDNLLHLWLRDYAFHP